MTQNYVEADKLPETHQFRKQVGAKGMGTMTPIVTSGHTRSSSGFEELQLLWRDAQSLKRL